MNSGNDRAADADATKELTMPSRGRERYSGEASTVYSDWHREELPSWYPALDIDLIEVDHRTGEPYLLTEVITIRSSVGLVKPWATHPLTGFKQRTYERLAELTGLPAYTIYCTPAVTDTEELVVDRIDADEPPQPFTGMSELCDWFDDLADRMLDRADEDD